MHHSSQHTHWDDHHYIFVYGTLRVGQTYHNLLGGRSPISTTHTSPEFDLVCLGEYPAMMTDGQTSVTGEVYQIDDHTLAKLDVLEDHPHFYQRQYVKVTFNNEVHQVWIYLLPRLRFEGGQYIKDGDWVHWVNSKARSLHKS